MKRSVQREAILDVLRSVKSHPTAEELHAMLSETMPRLSLATVYRNLEQFSHAGLVQKIDCGGELRRFDGNVAMHPHQRCPECGRVCDVENSRLTELQGEMEKLLPALRCRTLRIELCGVCNNCSSAQNEQEVQA
ncbi:MAG: transcriptional repressor [Lentisphaeria bacterium]|nr:transcriptional repressor [Lentisphaeria bacterium]